MARTSPFFIPQKEINLINSMNEELIDEIVDKTSNGKPKIIPVPQHKEAV